jgi:DNA-binding NtrC family response regulator
MKALVALSDPASVEALCEALAGTELDLEFCSTLGDLRATLGREKALVVFCQARLPDGTFRDLFKSSNPSYSETPVIICSDFFDKTTYIEAMSLGAYDYMAFPYRRPEVEWIMGNVLRKVPAPMQQQRVENTNPSQARVHAAHN